MGKLINDLKHQLNTNRSDDAKECIILYNILLGETEKVWASQWNALTNCKFIGEYPNIKRVYELNKLGKLIIKGHNCK